MQPLDNNLFSGSLIHLTAMDATIYSPLVSKWSRDTEYWRLQSSGTSRTLSEKETKAWIEKYLQSDKPDSYFFLIRTFQDDRVIGDIGLDGISLNHREAFVGIGIGEREYWGKGYGTDAMQVILGFAFLELNLQRVALNVFEYNPRAIRSYEKVGFTHEGRVRQYMNRDSRRWDLIYMGITRKKWEQLYL